MQDNELRQRIIEIVKHDTVYRDSVMQERIKDLAEEFLEQNYYDNELKAEIKYDIDLFRNGYKVTITVIVYPLQHPKAFRYEAIMRDMYFNYVYFDYKKERNVLGAILEQKLEPYIRLIELQEENEELKRENAEMEETIEELRERVEKLSRELERCK